MIEIEADFSTTVRGGLIRAYRSDAPNSVQVGDVVRAVDPEEELSYVGTIHALDGPFIYLMMRWRDAVNPISVPGGAWVSIATPLSEASGGGAGRTYDYQTVRIPVAV